MISLKSSNLKQCYFEEFCTGRICVNPKLCKKDKAELSSQEKFTINKIRRSAGYDPIEFDDEKVLPIAS